MKKVFILITLLMIIFTIYEITNSYAKYIANGTATSTKTAGAWVITVNNDDITGTSSTHEFTMNNLTYLDNEFVVEGKVAPSSEGYFDVDIDPTGTSVAIRFDVTIDTSELNISDLINFQSACKLVEGEEVSEGIIRTGANTYTGIISLEEVENGDITSARFYFKWEDAEGESGDIADSILGNERDISLGIPVEITVSQYSGETITEYVEQNEGN